MLGKLFNLGAVSGAGDTASAQTASYKSITSLDSVQEDIHTRNLLFPDPQDLFEQRLNDVFPLSSVSSVTASPSTNAYDYNGSIELDVRDVRVIVMQDALGSLTSSLLYDSQSPPTVQSNPLKGGPSSLYSAQDSRRNPTSPRKPSISHTQRPMVIQSNSPKTRQGAFENRSSLGRTPGHGHFESDSQRHMREYREELATFSSCIFGNSELMAYKGTSTKVHVVPTEAKQTDSGSAFADRQSSMGRASMRSSRLSQSFSSETMPSYAGAQSATSANRVPDRKRVLVTRLFPVSLPVEEDMVSPRSSFTEQSTGYPFPQAAEDVRNKKKKVQPKQKRTPMYAVALVINLPQSSPHYTPTTTSRQGFRESSSYQEQDSFPSSLNSIRPSGWTMVGQGGYGFESFETTFGSDTEDQIDVITQHWDIIMRTLNQLQSVVAKVILSMLLQADFASPDPLPAYIPSQIAQSQSKAGRRSGDPPPPKPPKTNAKHVTLPPNCLLQNRHISRETDYAKARIIDGIRAARVVTGQNRWPIWREEARWVARWAGGKEQGFFFNLLTGFLATHTDWLQALSPPSYRRRYCIQQKGRMDVDASVPNRTVIVAQDKSVARRLLFLLAAFLPASQQLPGVRPHRPSTAASFGTFSQSPPSLVVPILKEESLRRRINRRTGPGRACHSRNFSLQSQGARAAAVPTNLAHLSMESRHERRASDASSIRTTHLPIRGNDLTMQKSSAATTGAITPEMSIAHFAMVHRADSFASTRPGSSNSLAADDLKRISRSGSGGSQSFMTSEQRQTSRWGSVISGLWSTRRRDSIVSAKPRSGSIGQSEATTSPMRKDTDRAPMSPQTPGRSFMRQPGDVPTRAALDQRGNPKSPVAVPGENRSFSGQTTPGQKPQRIPDPSGAFESPVKTSINDDGVIDVDIPFPDYLASFETAVSSPSSSGYLSNAGFGTAFDTFEQSSRVSVDADGPLNAAGWLQSYHPDFVLQAMPAQEGLKEQIKASMEAEPPTTWVPNSSESATEKWVDVSTAIIADSTTFTITRIRYRRLVRASFGSGPNTPATMTPVAASPAPTLPSPSPFDPYIKDEFIEETLLSSDDTLVEAVEKVIATAGDISKGSSNCSSRSTSKLRERSDSTSSQQHPEDTYHRPRELVVPQEVPRSQCKTVILSALEEIIREVIEDLDPSLGQRTAGDKEASSGIGRRREKENMEAQRIPGSILREAVRNWRESVDMGSE
ncbi:folliculin-interacting protein N-terminus-domain-containing protein [Neurospora hispaniola]|uniref:Folliculin-interacting protein N-terminus-domain-containing protein n=1 Tax=Neurospora hispaniola TaxID=588809 RepID=A0AAJ0I1L7_9PEZI|nr:folliculin-interacting protein N-terminus-domain-containing protein [Neurospora hispaniola]